MPKVPKVPRVEPRSTDSPWSEIFKKDSPNVRLTALAIDCSPAVLNALGNLFQGLGKVVLALALWSYGPTAGSFIARLLAKGVA
jgi:hypothetical protein